jgi:microcystin-dependent protein
MSIMWNGSLIPWLDPNAAPYSGAQAFFFNSGTTTPRTVYIDSGLGEAHDHPVLANASGMFPAIFLPEGDYRLRLEDQLGVVIWDVDGISTPIFTDSGGGGGDTPVELLARTGDYKYRHGVGSHSGWVRAAGRTIGAAASGATERANTDCEDLFEFLWDQDATLTVSGGRGANAASDWAAAKTITLPDWRLRAMIGMASMGNTVSTVIPAATFDGGEDGDDLGATVGLATATVSIAQMPAHDHGGVTGSGGIHTHTVAVGHVTSAGGVEGAGVRISSDLATTSASPAHTHTVASQGSGTGHANVQPSGVVTVYIKL